MSTELKDKVAIITGGTRGIGFGIAQALLGEGARVFICGRDAANLEKAVAQLRAGHGPQIDGVLADVRQWADCRKLVQAAFERFSGLDILVNNAGVGHIYKPVDQITPEVWDTTIQTNLSGVFYCCREAVPIMRAQGGGYIFNISSVASVALIEGGSAYNASKSGLGGFSATILKDLRYDGIRVTEIVTGSVSTESRGYQPWKLAIEDITKVVIDLYQLPPRAMANRIEIWPAQPPRDI